MEFRGPAWLNRLVSTVGVIATVAALILLYLEYSGRLEDWDEHRYIAVDTTLCGLMLVEWTVLLVLAKDRRAYLKARWIDFIASLPLLLLARPLRLLRVIRLLLLIRAVLLFRRALRPWEKAVDMALLKSTATIAALTILVVSLLVMDLERNNPDLDQFGEALWWAIVTSTTVGYGDRVPTTGAGQFMAVLLMILGVGLFGTLAATLTSAITSSRTPEVTNSDLMDRIGSLEHRIDQLVESLAPSLSPTPSADTSNESD
jgi:voltage-gated potassium channel